MITAPSFRMRLAFVIGTVLLGTGCQRRSDVGPVVVSAIGGQPRVADASRKPLDFPEQMLTAATAQGLVRFDASGQVEPGLAERWIVIDNGLSYIIRLRDAEWSDGKPVTADQVVTVLRRQIAAQSHNPLARFLTAIDEVVGMTPQVIEIRLKWPRPDLLRLFAEPELSIVRTRPPGGSGPFRIETNGKGGILLEPATDPALAADEDAPTPQPEQNVRLIGERAARAITRFAERQSDLVSGGTFNDWPLVANADIPANNLHVDPAAGLFGLAVVERGGFLAEAKNRAAVAEAIDRAALVRAFTPNWQPAEQLLPDRLDSAAPPNVAGWTALGLADRRAAARAIVAEWRAAHSDPLTIRIALPSGPGATILYGMVGASLISVGIQPERVAMNADADLRLIDAVAPYDSARWYLATACLLCSDDTVAALEAARTAPTSGDRALAIAAADMAVNQDAAFIPLARPLRWSLVAARLDLWQANAHAWHPLNHLRTDTN